MSAFDDVPADDCTNGITSDSVFAKASTSTRNASSAFGTLDCIISFPTQDDLGVMERHLLGQLNPASSPAGRFAAPGCLFSQPSAFLTNSNKFGLFAQ